MAANTVELRVEVKRRWSYWPAMVICAPISVLARIGIVPEDFVGRFACRYMLLVEVVKCN